jgi:hypothetical protein
VHAHIFREFLAAILKAQVLAEERQNVVLKAVGDRAGVRAGKDLEGVGDAVAIENVVELAGVDAQAILITNVNGDCLVLAQIANVLIDECEG